MNMKNIDEKYKIIGLVFILIFVIIISIWLGSKQSQGAETNSFNSVEEEFNYIEEKIKNNEIEDLGNSVELKNNAIIYYTTEELYDDDWGGLENEE